MSHGVLTQTRLLLWLSYKGSHCGPKCTQNNGPGNHRMMVPLLKGLREAPASTHSAAATAEEATFLRSDAVSHVITGYHLGTLVGRDPLRQRPAMLQRLLW